MEKIAELTIGIKKMPKALQTKLKTFEGLKNNLKSAAAAHANSPSEDTEKEINECSDAIGQYALTLEQELQSVFDKENPDAPILEPIVIPQASATEPSLTAEPTSEPAASTTPIIEPVQQIQTEPAPQAPVQPTQEPPQHEPQPQLQEPASQPNEPTEPTKPVKKKGSLLGVLAVVAVTAGLAVLGINYANRNR